MRIRDFLEIDFPLFIASLLLTVFGILFIYSSGITSSGTVVASEYKKQIIWAAVGLAAILVISLLNYKRVYDFSFYLYGAILLVLFYTCVFGRMVSGSRSWIGIGGGKMAGYRECKRTALGICQNNHHFIFGTVP